MKLRNGRDSLELCATDNQIADWISDPNGSAELVYAAGTCGALSMFRTKDKEVGHAANYAWDLLRAVCLHRKIGPTTYEYLLQRLRGERRPVREIESKSRL